MTSQESLLEKLKRQVLVFDGAMGTMIYQRGVFLNACYDELCLTQPQLIRGIHGDYVDAGADVIETNSFGANRIKLAAYGLADRVADINRAAVRLAREAAGDAVYVAGSVGPCFAPGVAIGAGKAAEDALEGLRIMAGSVVAISQYGFEDTGMYFDLNVRRIALMGLAIQTRRFISWMLQVRKQIPSCIL